MPMRLIPHAAAISEFVAGYHGACGETAELCILHVINPDRYPLNAAQLARVIRRSIDHHRAHRNGSEPLSAIDLDFAIEGIRTTKYAYSQPPSFDWKGVLEHWGGIKPMAFEFAQARKLPGDEKGVHYHFMACLGWDPAAREGLFADGDNLIVRRGRNGPTGLVRYTQAELEAASVCGLLVAEYTLGEEPKPAPPPLNIPAGWTDDGATLTAPNGVTVIHNFRDYILHQTPAWPSANWPLEPEASVDQLELGDAALGGGSQQLFRDSALDWRVAPTPPDGGPVGVFEMPVGAELMATRNALSASGATVSAQQTQITDLQQQVSDLQQQLADAQQSQYSDPLASQ
jgi:hypothetical protein